MSIVYRDFLMSQLLLGGRYELYKYKTGNLELPYVDKVYITEDKTSYISLNTGKVVYLDNNQMKTYQFDMGRKAYKMLSYLMENNGDFVSSDTLYYDVFGQNITEKQDSIVDEVRRTLWKIACIKYSDIKIKNIVVEKQLFRDIH